MGLKVKTNVLLKEAADCAVFKFLMIRAVVKL